MRHWYDNDYKAFCGVNLRASESANYIGYLQIHECDCIKCLENFINIENRLSIPERNILAQKRLSELTYIQEFAKLINEEN